MRAILVVLYACTAFAKLNDDWHDPRYSCCVQMFVGSIAGVVDVALVPQALLRLLRVFWERQRHGRVLRSNEVRQVMHESGVTHWDEFRNLLQDCKLIKRTEEGGYVLTRDLRRLTLSQLLAMVPWPAEQQLRVNAHGKEPWEATLKQRCDEARRGLHRPLEFNLEALFENRVDEFPINEGEKQDE